MNASVSRRHFLRKSGLAVSAAPALAAGYVSFLNTRVRAADPGESPNEKVRLGLIGCGGMGQGDLECFFLNPEVECAVICDIDDSRIAKGMEICEKKGRRKAGQHQRISPRPGPQGCGCRPDRHTRPLARASDRDGVPGGQGRLRGKAARQNH